MSAGLNRNDHIAPYEIADPWDKVLSGDKDLFREMTEPYVPALLTAARRDIKKERANGNLSDTLSPEELVGDALIQAWTRRYSRSLRESLKEWLLANQRWALRLLVLQERDWSQMKAVSLEEPAKPRLDDDGNDDWDWITPQCTARECWRDVIADENSISHAA